MTRRPPGAGHTSGQQRALVTWTPGHTRIPHLIIILTKFQIYRSLYNSPFSLKSLIRNLTNEICSREIIHDPSRRGRCSALTWINLSRTENNYFGFCAGQGTSHTSQIRWTFIRNIEQLIQGISVKRWKLPLVDHLTGVFTLTHIHCR